MAMGLRVWMVAGNELRPDTWIRSGDVDAHDGFGDGEVTHEPLEALRFADGSAALGFWRTQSTVRPYRDDGRPNRPLTAMTIETDITLPVDPERALRVLCPECGAQVDVEPGWWACPACGVELPPDLLPRPVTPEERA